MKLYPVAKSQIVKIHQFKNAFKLDEETYRDLINQYTNSRSNSSKDMYWHEAAQLINYFDNCGNDSTNRQRRKMIGIAHTMGWNLFNETNPLKPKADMDRINNWCVKFGFGHKPLNDYTTQELPKLITQFQAVFKSHLNK
jgi:hypothetical protein